MADLTIQINGDMKNYEDALSAAQKKTEALNSKLEELSIVAGVAFAAMSAEIYESVKAFGESQKASNELVQALQNQGIYSKELQEDYKKQGEELQRLTGIDNDKITSAQALLQGMIGNVHITKELTAAILDLSVIRKKDLMAVTELVGKGIEGHTAALLREGIVVDASLDKAGRTAKIISEISVQMGGQAAKANEGIGAMQGLHRAFDDIQKNIGEKFAPAVEMVIKSMTKFFQIVGDHKEIINVIVALTTAGTVVSGLALTVGLGGVAWLQYTAMMTAAGIATGAMSVAAMTLMGATGIGLIVIGLTELYLHWSTWWPWMQNHFSVFVETTVQQAQGLGKILQGVFHLDMNKINEGRDQINETHKLKYKELQNISDDAAKKAEESQTVQDANKAAAYKIKHEKEIEAERIKNAILEAEQDLLLSKLNGDSKAVIDLKTQELDTLKALQDVKNAGIRNDLNKHLAEIQAVQDLADEKNDSKVDEVNNELLAKNRAYQALDSNEKKLFLQQNQTALVNSEETKKTIKAKYALQELQVEQAARTQFLMDEQQYGTVYAAINEAMHSKIYTGTKSAFNDMADMTNSHQATLKAIGKAAAIANITIKTAESAMNIFAGFSTIPFIGEALGIAGAAAAVAYGAEQLGTIAAMAEGGIVTGGVPGMDSVPAMLMPGELVVPKSNFEEVIGSVTNSRSEDSAFSQGGENNMVNIVLSLQDNLMDFIEAKLVERQRFNISLIGHA